MSLFQTSVVKKYLNDLSPDLLDKKYNDFQAYFGDTERQENIRNLKEEEFQSEFIRNLFVNIFDYTLNPEPNFNIVLEKKNVDDSKKADGAILRNKEVIAVIELKSTQTTDLDTVETQAFGYKNHNPNCQYIITSNFEKIRIYIQNAIDHLEFDLFKLSKEEFAMLWLCFSKDNILNDIPHKIKEASVLQEENVTKKLYNDYSKFRKDIFDNIVKNNPEFDKLVLFKKTQKLLDRFLFIFFAEDRLLLPPNSISEIVKQWTTLKDDLDEYVPLYERFKKYFGYLNTGHKGKKHEIFAYNGGLFASDNILDNIKIDDEVLHQNTVKLSTYDFETDVDVNILGHIFEHSLGEIENIQAEIAGEEVDNQKTKRKKDGIFYTPKYITKYIVENTIGKLCEEKRAELGIIDEEYAKGRKNRKKDIIRDLDDKLTAYRDWLIDITILDPACGSGAFLNQALEFLIQEHKKIDELKTQLLGGSIVFSDIEAKILENNIYGVDLNEESVDIAKLSLWLRTAQKGRKLTTLSNHIKCGNSLIDDPVIAEDKAFNWQNEFPEVFAKGGFDVVIGNPPYTYRNAISEEEREYFKNNFKSVEGNYDLYKFFVEKIVQLSKNKGYSSFIIPNTFLTSQTYKKLRKILIENFAILEFFDLGLDIFDNVVVESVIFNFKKVIEPQEKQMTKIMIQRDRSRSFENLQCNYIIDLLKYSGEDSLFNTNISTQISPVIDKMINESKLLGTICYCTVGINTGYIKDDLTEKNKIDNRYHKMLNGKDIGRNYVKWNGEWIMYDADFVKSKGDKGRSLPQEYVFLNEKILVQRTRRGMKRKLICYYDTEQYYNLNRLSNIVLEDKSYSLKYIYSLLNSTLLDFFFNNFFNEYEVKPLHLSKLPIKKTENQHLFEEEANKILMLNKNMKSKVEKYLTRINDNFNIGTVSRKLETFYHFDFKTFVTELKKQKIYLSLVQQDEWEEYFNTYKNEINLLQSEIDKTDKKIDQMVYELYGLIEEEIKIVEES